MGVMQLTSQITFLYFDDLKRAKEFFTDTLGLEIVYDPGWACVFRTGKGAYIGAVDAKGGSIEVGTRGGFLISLTVNNIEEVWEDLNAKGLSVPEIKKVKEIALNSFIFTGPEGYKFEIQQFTSGELRSIF